VADQVAPFELESYMRHMPPFDADPLSRAHGLEVRVPLLGGVRSVSPLDLLDSTVLDAFVSRHELRA
jgi:hypothetical protein